MKKAFTLIELLVVVLIIGILSAVALPQYQRAVKKARYTQLVIASRAIADAERLYHLANGSYTTTAEDLGDIYPISGSSFVLPKGGFCNLADTYMYCSSGDGSVAYHRFYADNAILCCTYSGDNYAGDFFCQQETGTTTWSNGCGENVCRCYLK